MKTETEALLKAKDEELKELSNKLAGITMFNVITDQIKDTHTDAVSYLLNNLKTIQGLFEEKMK